MKPNSLIRVFLLFVMATLLSACGGDDEAPAPTLNSISIAGINSQYIEGEQADVYVTGSYSNGTTSTVGGAEWNSINPDVAYVNTDSLLVALKPGSTTITATVNGLISETVDVEITEAILTKLEVLGERSEVPAGIQVQLTARGTFNNGITKALDDVIWGTSDAAIAEVNEHGLVSTLTEGEAQLSATQGEHTANYDLTVTPAELISINIKVKDLSLPVGFTTTAQAFGVYTDDTTHSLNAVNWSSSHENVFIISDQGQISGIGTGQAELTAAVNEVVSDPVGITVTNAVAVDMVMQPESLEIPVGMQGQAQPVLIFSDNSTKDVDSAEWLSSNESVITVDQKGLMAGQSVGEAIVTATTDGFSADVAVKVTEAVTVSIEVIPGTVNTPAGTSVQMALNANMSDGTAVNVTDNATGSVSSDELGTLSTPTEGKATFYAGSKGEGTISAFYAGFSDQVDVVVTDAIPVALSYELADGEKPEAVQVPLGLNQIVRLSVEYSDGTIVYPESDVNWTIADSTIAQISTDGSASVTVTGVKLESTTLTATFAELTIDIPVIITEAVPVELVLSDAEMHLDDDPMAMTAILLYSDASQADVTESVFWTSANEHIAQVSNLSGQKGVVTAVSEGEVQLTAVHGHQELTSNAIVTIKPPRLLSGFLMFDFSDNKSAFIGKNSYEFELKFSVLHTSNIVMVYANYTDNKAVAGFQGAYDIADVYDASMMKFSDDYVTLQPNGNETVGVLLNANGYYAVIQLHEAREESLEYGAEVVMLSWAIRTDGGKDFSSFTQKKEQKLFECFEGGFYGDGGCKERNIPYNVSSSKESRQLPLPSSFNLGAYSLISLGEQTVITNISAEDRNDIVEPFFDGIQNQQIIPANHSTRFTLEIPPTSNKTASPSYQFNLDNNPAKSFSYTSSFTSN